MRSSYGPETLLLASKKPRIIELIAKSKSISIEEIQSLDEKPDIIKGLIAIKKLEDQKISEINAEMIADMMVAASIKNN
jgi:hypothetical protein